MSAPVSAVVTTRNRRRECERAIVSVLAQEPAVREVIVCDDASQDGTGRFLRDWAAREPRLRYERFARPRGGPAAGRNRGVELAREEWVAFLDDDDSWLPGKLARQLDAVATDDADVVACNALRADGKPYLEDLRFLERPERTDLLRANRIVLSSAMVRRESLRSVGGFDERQRLAGIEDYDAWLRMADAGARFVLLPEALVRYEDVSPERFGARQWRTQRRLARHAWGRWSRRPTDRGGLVAALRRTSDCAIMLAQRTRR